MQLESHVIKLEIHATRVSADVLGVVLHSVVVHYSLIVVGLVELVVDVDACQSERRLHLLQVYLFVLNTTTVAKVSICLDTAYSCVSTISDPYQP